jgi:hypothetical protein
MQCEQYDEILIVNADGNVCNIEKKSLKTHYWLYYTLTVYTGIYNVSN